MIYLGILLEITHSENPNEILGYAVTSNNKYVP